MSLLKAKLFPRFKALHCVSAFFWDSLKNPSLSFVQSFSLTNFHFCFTQMVSFFSVAKVIMLKRFCGAASRGHHRLPFILPYPTSFTEASLSLLRVTLTHFSPSACEGILRLPISFPFQARPNLE